MMTRFFATKYWYHYAAQWSLDVWIALVYLALRARR